MRKFFRLIFSRFSLVALAVILQVAAMVALAVLLEGHYLAANIVITVIAVLVLIHIINRDTLSDNKLPWVIVVALVPVFGIIVYFIFGRHTMSKKHRRKFRETRSQTVFANSQSAENTEKFRDELGAYYGQSRFLLDKSFSATYTDTETVYFPSGEEFFADLTTQLEKAEKFIFVEFFIAEHGKMLDTVLDILQRKVAEGVEVRLMLDDFGCVSKLKMKDFKDIQNKGIHLVRFAPLIPIASDLHNNRDHRKIVIIDGKVGYTGGINLTDEYINEQHPYGYWKDSAIRLRGEGVRGLTVLFLQNYGITSGANDNFADYLPHCEKFDEKGFVIPFADGPKPQYVDHVAQNAYLNVINTAQKTLYITTPYLIADEILTTAIIAAANRGVDVRIVTPAIPDKKFVFALTRFSYEKLMAAGVKIFQYTPGFIHAKNLIADGEAGIVGTINLDYRSMMHHYECAVFMYKTAALKTLAADMEKVFEESRLQTKESAKQNFFVRLICLVTAAFRPIL